MFSFTRYTSAIIALLLVLFSSSAMAGPGGPGGPGGGPRWGMGPGHWGPGPAWGHHFHGPRYGLPDGAYELWVGSLLYFVAAGTYYMWNADEDQYVVVSPPAVEASEPAADYNVVAYPERGQSPDQQARDRYECHGWAVSQSGFDPAAANEAPPEDTVDLYRRSLTACLSARGYTVR